MKISLGMNLQSGPWGGGNQFGLTLAKFLERRGLSVSFDLRDHHLDMILLAEPRAALKISAYTDREIFEYLRRVNPRAIVMHRVNECDERKQTTGLNKRLISANRCADATVFVSAWLKELLLGQGMPSRSCHVILNGSDRSIFHARGYCRWDRSGPLRIVTHHWGGGWLKGFDIYERVDRLLLSERFRGKLGFTFIGNVPEGFRFVNATYVPPLHGDTLASEIRGHHVYLTASQNEPGGHHQNEGANCGLPVLYRESGSLPEYCGGFGVAFTDGNIEDKLEEMMASYEVWADRMKGYPHTSERTNEQYYNLFIELLDQREDIVRQRKWWRWPVWALASTCG